MKLYEKETGEKAIMSHPVRVRGLKLTKNLIIPAYKGRTPCGCVD